MEERQKMIAQLEAYQDQFSMSSDVGYHLRQLIEALQSEEVGEDDQ